ncbi:DegT/DnrJ/EryC1/StrS family aminotransferase [Acidithiobacillus sp.]|uniref:DegT/DnrJ/EryC1/StrS family aminotransferase n=1 Tax=Acidithiobacillus sp. TaxID=1872118 RepID=UPI003D03A627
MMDNAKAVFRFPFQRPDFPAREQWVPFLDESYARHWFSNSGPLVRQLEAMTSAAIGRPCLAVSSGTMAIQLALLALDKAPGPVILPSFTFAGTLSAVVAAGYEPVLADVDENQWELGVAQLEAIVEGMGIRPCAVVAVRTFGQCSDYSPLEQWCRAHGIALILDSAGAFGGSLANGQPVGGQGIAECFSLHATKVFCAGEGGLLCGAPELMERARKACNFGLSDGGIDRVGTNGKMSEFTAAVALAQFPRVTAAVKARREWAERYIRTFSKVAPEWRHTAAPEHTVFQAFPVLAPDAQRRADAEIRLRERGVQTRRYYHPALHETEAAQGVRRAKDLSVSSALASRMLCLPMYSRYSDIEVEEMDSILRSVAW